jgi:hypothetical protein
MYITKNEAMKSIVKTIDKLLSNDEIVFNGRTKLNIVVKDYYIKTIKNPTITLNKEMYSLDEPISFTGTGIFVFVENVSERSKGQNTLIPGEDDYYFSGEAHLDILGKEYITSIKDKALTIQCKHL